MSKFIISCILFLLSLNLYALDIKAEIEFQNDQQIVREGDVFSAILRLWPLPEANLKEFSGLENKTLFGSFLVLNIANVRTSANNADVVEVEADFVFTDKNKYVSTMPIKLGALEARVNLQEISSESLAKKREEYVLLNQKVSWSKVWLYSSVFLLIGVTLAFFYRKELYDFFDHQFQFRKKAKKKAYSLKFNEARSRIDYETLYREKDQWLELYEKDKFHVQEFFKIINTFQYRESWSESELEEVRKSFEVIRRSLE